mmetsp:Transcript_13266/g.13330  ORF Transcript_13266/g.13330 Transcript_13266/m.13330 type:complete len:462 (+) Transcript_13266:74-1459(+)
MSGKTALEHMLADLPQYKDRRRIRDEVDNLTSTIRTLVAKTGTFVQNNGENYRLLLLGGTVPIHYRGHEYNIPVEIFLFPDYPSLSPMIYLRPTQDMAINPNNPNVHRDGLVDIPYLHSWSPSHSLQELLSYMASAFSEVAPLFVKPDTSLSLSSMHTTVSPSPSTSRSLPLSLSLSSQSASTPSYSQSSYPANRQASGNSLLYNPNTGGSYSQYLGGALPAAYPVEGNNSTSSMSYINRIPYTTSTTIPYQSSANTAQRTSPTVYNPQNNQFNPIYSATSTSTSTMSPSDMKTRLIESIKLKLKDSFQTLYEDTATEIDVELDHKSALEMKSEDLTRSMREITEHKHELQEALSKLQQKSHELDQWEKEREREKETSASLQKDVEDFFVPYDELSDQLTKLSSEILSTDDTMDQLAREYKRNRAKIGDFLQEIRRLSSKQFLAKANIIKINQILNSQGVK